MNSLNFGKDSAKDKYEEFLEDYNDYINDNLSIIKAKRLANSAWHLVDWTFQEGLSTHNFTDIGNYRESLYPNCLSLKVMHDLANTTKHKLLTRPKADLKNTKEHQGEYSNEYSSEYNISYLQLEKNDGTILNFVNEAKNVKDFWQNYFEK
tara:strand:- start:102 stop:554 length:453 start_codon:yes stop_codon:yes gene_type:complete